MLQHHAPETLASRLAGVVGRSTPVAPVWVCLRRNGQAIGSQWLRERTFDKLFARMADFDRWEKADFVELTIPDEFSRIDPEDKRCIANIYRGRRSYHFRYGDLEVAIPATNSIATNREVGKERDRFLAQQGASVADLRERGVSQWASGTSVLLYTDADGCIAVRPLFRGNELVQPESISGAEAFAMLDRLCHWVRVNQRADGALPYKYWPSRGEYSDSDNAIRQMLATLALVRAAKRDRWSDLAGAAASNLKRNLAAYFVDCGDYGAFACSGKGKLGATALGALCVLEHEGVDGPKAATLGKLRAGVDRLWQADGSFRTFFWPADRNDCQNFYPGEALLFYACLYRHTEEADPRDRARRTFRYYREWHRARRNPAFIPWHTQACVGLFRAIGDPELRDFVFEMNDRLITTQQWGGGLPQDVWGRFYDPNWPGYGPPHAASTGVYLEGLAFAHALATEAGDDARASAYRGAIRRGLRNLRQLQIVSDADMFYVSKPQHVQGAIRTEVYNNEIRLDNVGHTMLALLDLPSWSVADDPARDSAVA